MSDNPLETSPEREAAIEKRAKALQAADGSTGSMDEYRERADELIRMEMAGAPAQKPIDEPEFIEEASIQKNLGEFPGGGSVADQGEWQETPSTRDDAKADDAQPGRGDAP